MIGYQRAYNCPVASANYGGAVGHWGQGWECSFCRQSMLVDPEDNYRGPYTLVPAIITEADELDLPTRQECG